MDYISNLIISSDLMDNIYFEKAIETIYCHIMNYLPKDICRSCPVVRMLGEITEEIKQQNNSAMAEQLSITALKLSCPFQDLQKKD